MQKTKLGISVGLLGAVMCFTGLFSGYLVAVVLMGYILLFESNEWLRKTAVKVIVVMISFSALSALIGFIPDAIGLIDDVFGIFGGSFSISFISNIVILVNSVLNILEKIILLLLGFKALSMGTFSIGPIDSIADKHYLGKGEESTSAKETVNK